MSRRPCWRQKPAFPLLLRSLSHGDPNWDRVYPDASALSPSLLRSKCTLCNVHCEIGAVSSSKLRVGRSAGNGPHLRPDIGSGPKPAFNLTVAPRSGCSYRIPGPPPIPGPPHRHRGRTNRMTPQNVNDTGEPTHAQTTTGGTKPAQPDDSASLSNSSQTDGGTSFGYAGLSINVSKSVNSEYP